MIDIDTLWALSALDFKETLNSVRKLLIAIGAIIGAIGFMLIGIKAVVSAAAGKGMRDLLSGVGMVALGLILIGAASALAGFVMSIAESIQ